MNRKKFLSWFYLLIVIVAIGAAGAIGLAFFKIDSSIYNMAFGFLAIGIIFYKALRT